MSGVFKKNGKISYSYNNYMVLKEKNINEKESNIASTFYLSYVRNHTGSLFHLIENGKTQKINPRSPDKDILKSFSLLDLDYFHKENHTPQISEYESKFFHIKSQFRNDINFKESFLPISVPLNVFSKFILEQKQHNRDEIRYQSLALFENLIGSIKDKSQKKIAQKILGEMITYGSNMTNRIDLHIDEKNKNIENYALSCSLFVNILFKNIPPNGKYYESLTTIKDLLTLAISSAGLLLVYEKKSYGQKILLFAKHAFFPLTFVFSTLLDTASGHFLSTTVIGTGLIASYVTPIIFAAGGFVAGLALIYGLHKFTNYLFEIAANKINITTDTNIKNLFQYINNHQKSTLNTDSVKINGKKSDLFSEWENNCLQSLIGINQDIYDIPSSILNEDSNTNRVRSTLSSVHNPSHLNTVMPSKARIKLFRDGPKTHSLRIHKLKLIELERKCLDYFNKSPSIKPAFFTLIQDLQVKNLRKTDYKGLVKNFISEINNFRTEKKLNKLMYLCYNLGNISDNMSRPMIINCFQEINKISEEISQILVSELNTTNKNIENDLLTFLKIYIASSSLYLAYDHRQASHKFWRYLFVGIIPATDVALEGVNIAMGDILNTTLNSVSNESARIGLETITNMGISLPIIGIGIKLVLLASSIAKKKDKSGIYLPNNNITLQIIDHLETCISENKLTIDLANKLAYSSSFPINTEKKLTDVSEKVLFGDIDEIYFRLHNDFMPNKFCAIKVFEKHETIYTIQRIFTESLNDIPEGFLAFPFTRIGSSFMEDQTNLLENKLNHIKNSENLIYSSVVPSPTNSSISDLEFSTPKSIDSHDDEYNSSLFDPELYFEKLEI